MYIDERQTVHTTNQKKKKERKKKQTSFCWDINDEMSINDIR